MRSHAAHALPGLLRGSVACFAMGVVLLTTLVGASIPAWAAGAPSDFSLQVSPSPLVTTVTPGKTTEVSLLIRNAGTGTERLKIEPRSFTVTNSSTNVQLNDTTPPDIARWISFSNPTFSVQPGQAFTEKVRFSLPKDTGFSYSFALIISRQSEPEPTSGGRLIKGSVAVFTLVNVNRPGASRKLDVVNFQVSKHVYEYLPATFTVKLKNTGNTIVQPFGDLFIQRGKTSVNPLADVSVNSQKGYILPGTERILSTQWQDGFPAYKTTTDANGKTTQHLVWDWSKLSNFRIGRYTANLVAAYDDGQGHDVPIQGQVSFWVIPWKILLGLLIAGLLLLFGLYSLIKKIIATVRKLTTRNKPHDSAPTPEN